MQPTGGAFSKSAKKKVQASSKNEKLPKCKNNWKNAFANLPLPPPPPARSLARANVLFVKFFLYCLYCFLRKKCNTPESFALTALALANVSGKLNVFLIPTLLMFNIAKQGHPCPCETHVNQLELTASCVQIIKIDGKKSKVEGKHIPRPGR